ncbi:MAG: hypothetical protein J6Y60_05455 [Treponema sp.]|nr:hypothetical protein [Treponema sp.]
MKINARIIVLGFMTATLLLNSCKKNNTVETENIVETNQITEEIQTPETIEVQAEKEIQEEEPEISGTPASVIDAKIDALGYQHEDKLKVNYRNGPNDGYSWHSRECNYDINDKTLSKEKLLSTLWLLDDELNKSYRLLFYSDDYFMIGSHYVGPSAFGKYRIEDDKLILYDYLHVGGRDFYDKMFTGEEVIGELKFESDSFLVDNELLFNGVRFIPNGCPKPDGSHALIDGINAIAVNLKVVLTDNVKFRTEPNTNSKTIVPEIYEEIFCNEPNWRMPDCLVKGEVLTLYARTENLETIDGETAYWYYTGMPTIASYYDFGWIFGGWFEEYDESKKDEYFKIQRKYFE